MLKIVVESNNKNVVIFLFMICKNMKNLKAFWTDLVLSMENDNLSLKIYSLFCFQFCRDLYAACSSGNE